MSDEGKRKKKKPKFHFPSRIDEKMFKYLLSRRRLRRLWLAIEIDTLKLLLMLLQYDGSMDTQICFWFYFSFSSPGDVHLGTELNFNWTRRLHTTGSGTYSSLPLSLSLSLSRTLIDSEECVSNKVSVASLSLYDSHTSVSITHTEQGMDEWEGESLWTEHIGEIVFER